MPVDDLAARKQDHLRIAARPDMVHRDSAGLDDVRLRHRALPGRDLADVGTRTSLLGATLAAPVLVSAMTGGTDAARLINDRLARAAAEHGAGMTLGSGRPLLRDRALLSTYRSSARPPLLLGNLGAAQLLEPTGLDDAARLVELLGADGLSIHLNPLQEAVQPEGEPHFAGVGERISETVDALAPLPVVVKEVGFGMDARDVAELAGAGVAAIDVAGSGGTNWALVEGERDGRARDVAAAFSGWGVPTVAALLDARAAAPELAILASGGIRDGVDVARCLALGARAVGLARVLLVAAQADRTDEALGTVLEQLRIATWVAGAPSTGALGPEHLREVIA